MTTTPAEEATVTEMPTTDDVLHEAEVVNTPAVQDQPDTPPEPGTDDEIAAEKWDHETIEFLGDTLHVRKPTDQALQAFSLSSSRFVKPEKRNDMTGLFINQHLSPASYDRVFMRLMDPDEPDYTVDTIAELMRVIVELTVPPEKTSQKG